jgi:outer membrane receptor protein involved in Fe transport
MGDHTLGSIAAARNTTRTAVFSCFMAFVSLFASPAMHAQSARADALNEFTIDAQPLDTALNAFALQAKREIFFTPDLARGKRTHGIRGKFRDLDALKTLLEGTGLTYTITPSAAILIRDPSTPPAAGSTHGAAPTGQGDPPSSNGSPVQDAKNAPDPSTQPSERKPQELDEVVVTGTHIRGAAPVGSSLKVYSEQDIQQSGAGTVDQFARQMVENFSGADAVANNKSTIGFSRFNGGAINNYFGGSAFNLHGLGPTATLTLLNGHRIASAGIDGSLVDISQIPLSAIDHIEVLTDGASAIYGADAVAGVVNIITRRDFDGAETGLRYAAATDGGAIESTGSQLLGTSWTSGNALLNYEYDRQNGLDASQRDFIPDLGGPNSLLPKNKRNSFLFSGMQELSAATTLTLDAMYADRDYASQQFFYSTIEQANQPSSGDAKQGNATLALDQALAGDWHMTLTGNYSKLRQFDDSTNDASAPGFSQHAVTKLTVNTNVLDAELLASGSLFTLPGGAVKAAVGTSYRNEKFDSHTFQDLGDGMPQTYSVPDLSRHVSSAYAEMVVPLIDADNAVSGAQRLLLSAAGRYDDYSDFGSTTNPKFGVLWEPVKGFDLRGNYGKSYRAPLLQQLGQALGINAVPLPNAAVPAGYTYTLILNGGNPNLKPERATTYSFGFDVKEPMLSGFAISASYFHTAFRDRISTPPVTGINYFDDPVLDSFLTLNPPLSEVEALFKSPGFLGDPLNLGPAGIGAIFDNRSANVARTSESGIDANANFTLASDAGQWIFAVSGTYLFKNEFIATTTAPTIELLSTFGEPTRFKGRGSVTWANAGFTTSLALNYVNSYHNNLSATPESIGAWPTLDLFVSYTTDATVSNYLLRNLRISLSANNLTNRKPPFVDLSAIAQLPGEHFAPFDPANASPVGRLLALSVNKRW